MEPKFTLEEVRALIDNVDSDDHIFGWPRALTPVVSNFQITNSDAKKFILKEICKLEIKNFCESIYMNQNVYDVYGKIIEDVAWYIKFSVIEDEKGKFLHSISFHPIEKQLKTNSQVLEP